MIPRADVTAWRASAPWPTDAQVEQDLVLSRALVEMFSNAENAIRAVLDPWLDEPRRGQGHGRVTLLYRFETTSRPVQQMRLKVEINTREYFSVLGRHRRGFAVDNPWYSGKADVQTYQPEELLATKLRALYQRRKGRDLYDLWLALTSLALDDERLIECFERYLAEGGHRISRAEFEANLAAKLESPAFLEDLAPLLPAGANYDVSSAAALVHGRVIAKLRGDPWKGGAT